MVTVGRVVIDITASTSSIRDDITLWEFVNLLVTTSNNKKKVDLILTPKQTITFKVTVQFETEANGQNEIVSHMDRSEIKL